MHFKKDSEVTGPFSLTLLQPLTLSSINTAALTQLFDAWALSDREAPSPGRDKKKNNPVR